MKAKIEASAFKRMIDNTKKFLSKYDRQLMQYIFLEADAEAQEIKATALDGHRVSVEYVKAEVSESFKCYMKANIPKITKHDYYVELELTDGRLLVTVGDNITGYKQPEGEYYKVGQLISDVNSQEVAGRIGVDAKLLKEALESANYGHSRTVILEIPKNPKAPIVIRPYKNERCIKIVLPVNVPLEGNSARDSQESV